MSTRWLYRLAVGTPTGAIDWLVHSDDPAPADWTTGGTPGLVLDGLAVSHKIPEDGTWPCQPSPPVLTFQVAALTASELAELIQRGQPVGYLMAQWNPAGAGSWVLSEYGMARVTEVELEARDGYTVATVTAIDPVTMLGEVVIGDEVWPLEAMQTRVNRIMGLVAELAPELPSSWDYVSIGDAPAVGMHTAAAEQDVDARPALEVLLELLGSWVVGGPVAGGGLDPRYGGYARYELTPYNSDAFNAVLDAIGLPSAGDWLDILAVDGWRLSRRTVAPYTKPPAVFGDTGGNVWGVVMSATSGTGIVAAGAVELPSRWSQRIGGIPTQAVVVVPFAGYTAGQGQYHLRWALPQANIKPRVRVKYDARIEFGVSDDATYQSGIDAAYQLAFLLIPDTINPATSWGTDRVVWKAEHADYTPWPFYLGSTITVTDVDPAKHPADKAWIHGVLDSYTIRVSDGMPVIEFGTRPQLRDGIHADVLKLANVPAGVTLAELDPNLTIEDLRLLRNP